MAVSKPEGPRMAVMQEAARPRPAGTPDTPDTPPSTRFRLPRCPCTDRVVIVCHLGHPAALDMLLPTPRGSCSFICTWVALWEA